MATGDTTDIGLVVEDNRFEDSKVGIDMREGVNAVLKNNVFDNVDEHVRNRPYEQLPKRE
ncbi:MAG: hypothetical protein J7M40_07110 [Planctomycetes bacterium]|nr:hypothetical protein [Planctomycetota bacterium]